MIRREIFAVRGEKSDIYRQTESEGEREKMVTQNGNKKNDLKYMYVLEFEYVWINESANHN